MNRNKRTSCSPLFVLLNILSSQKDDLTKVKIFSPECIFQCFERFFPMELVERIQIPSCLCPLVSSCIADASDCIFKYTKSTRNSGKNFRTQMCRFQSIQIVHAYIIVAIVRTTNIEVTRTEIIKYFLNTYRFILSKNWYRSLIALLFLMIICNYRLKFIKTY